MTRSYALPTFQQTMDTDTEFVGVYCLYATYTYAYTYVLYIKLIFSPLISHVVGFNLSRWTLMLEIPCGKVLKINLKNNQLANQISNNIYFMLFCRRSTTYSILLLCDRIYIFHSLCTICLSLDLLKL